MSFRNLLADLIPPYLFRILARVKVGNSKNADFSKKKIIDLGNSVLLAGFNIRVDHPREEKKYVKIGNDCMLSCSIIFESEDGEVIIGDRVFIGNSEIICRSKIEFGKNIFVAWGCTFYDHDSHSLDYEQRKNDISQQLADHRNGHHFIKNKDWSTVNSKPIKINDNAWIGMKCLILKGVTIGEGAIVGAGSVITKDVEAWTVVAGNPARVVKRLNPN